MLFRSDEESLHAIRRSLATDRTILAAERTYAAWLRTGLAFLGSGLAAQRFLLETLATWQLIIVVFSLLSCSIVCFLAAGWRDLRVRSRSKDAEMHLLPQWITLGLSGLLTALAIFAAIAIWLL